MCVCVNTNSEEGGGGGGVFVRLWFLLPSAASTMGLGEMDSLLFTTYCSRSVLLYVHRDRKDYYSIMDGHLNFHRASDL